MKIFSKGKEVEYNGRIYTVEFTHLKGMDLFVKLEGVNEQVDARHLHCEPTVFRTNRTEM